MAYETFAGGKLGSGPEATSQSTKPRGGYIPLGDIPNAPKTVDMPLAEYQAIPSIRHDYLKSNLNAGKWAEALQQKPLPSSFEEAGNIRAGAAGKGQAAWAEATASVGEDMVKAIGSVGKVFEAIATKAASDKDAMAELYLSKYTDVYNAKLSGIPNLPPDKQEDAKKEADAEYIRNTTGLGTRPATQAKIQASRDSVLDVSGLKLTNQLNLKSMERDNNFAQTMLEDGRKTKNYDMANKATAKLQQTGAYTPEQAKHEYEKTAFLQGVDTIDEAKLSPEGAMRLRDQAEIVRKGGKSKDFSALNSNPALAPNVEYEANEAFKKHKQDGLTDVVNKIRSGDLKTPEDVEKAAKGKFLSKDTIEGLKKATRQNVEMDPAKHVAVREDIAAFNAAADKGGTEYERIYTKIQTTVDPEHRSYYEGKLLAKVEAASQPEKTKVAEREADHIINRGKEQDKAALMVDPSMRQDLVNWRNKMALRDRELEADKIKIDEKTGKVMKGKVPDEKYEPTAKEWAAYHANGTAMKALQDSVDEAVRKNPDAKPGEIMKEVYEGNPIFKNLERNAGEAATAVPTASPRATPTSIAATRDQLIAAQKTTPPSGLPRNVQLGGKTGSPAYEKAFVSEGDRSDVEATAYVPDNSRMEGPKALGGPARREGEPYYIEDYVDGRRPHVSMAMDSKSELQGKYVVYSAHPNVVFRVEDVGEAFEGKGDTRVDIASRNPDWKNNYKTDGTLKVISAAEAKEIADAAQQGTVSANVPGVVPELTAKLGILEQQFGRPLKVVSAYRNPSKNERVGGAIGSEHIHRNAVDIDGSGMSLEEKKQLIIAARQVGIKGIGVYENNLHFDLGLTHGARAWGPDHTKASVPAWARPLLQGLI